MKAQPAVTRPRPPRFSIVSQELLDEALIGLFRRPNSLVHVARAARKPAVLIAERVRALLGTGDLVRTADGKIVDRRFAKECA